jgi:large repetitive protein
MDDGANGEFSLVLSGAGYPDLTEFTVTAAEHGLVTGHLYRFYVVSENHVGLSTSASAIAGFRACKAPEGVEPPERVDTSWTSVSVSWSPPADDGGCAITGYALLLGDEADATPEGLSYTEVHASDIRDRPTLDSFTVTDLPATVAVGTTLRFRLTAFN